jgi:hypothetical protein
MGCTLRGLGGLFLGCALGLAGGSPLTFTLFADNRGAPGLVGVLEAVRRAGGPGAFVLTPGDTDPPSTTRGQLDQVFGRDCPWYPVVGNHETGTAAHMTYLRQYFRTHLQGKVNPGPAGAEETCYSFDAGSVHIAVINVHWDGRGGGDDASRGEVSGPLLKWLEADLARTRQTFKLVVGHKPAYPAPDQDFKDARHMEDSLNASPASRDAFWKLLGSQRVAVYICGHTHRYSLLQPLGGKVWQLDVAQARGDADWKYDVFALATADDQRLRIQVFRDLTRKGHFELRQTLDIKAADLR